MRMFMTIRPYTLAHTNCDPLGCRMEKLGISKAVDFGSGYHMLLYAQSFAEYTLSELARDPHVMLAHFAGR